MQVVVITFFQRYLVALANWKTRSRSIIYTQSAFIWWKDCENRSSISIDIRLNTPLNLHSFIQFTNKLCLLWSYWTKVHEIFTRYRDIFYADNAHIEVAISHFSECQSNKWGEFAIFPQNWFPWQRPLRYRKKRSRSIIYARDYYNQRFIGYDDFCKRTNIIQLRPSVSSPVISLNPSHLLDGGNFYPSVQIGLGLGLWLCGMLNVWPKMRTLLEATHEHDGAWMRRLRCAGSFEALWSQSCGSGCTGIKYLGNNTMFVGCMAVASSTPFVLLCQCSQLFWWLFFSRRTMDVFEVLVFSPRYC